MSLPRRSGKRRRSPSSGSDSFSGEGDSSVSPQLRGRPVLSPPPGLGRGRRLTGTGNSSNSGATRPRAAGAEGSRGRYSNGWARRVAGLCTPAAELDGQREGCYPAPGDSNTGDRFPLGHQHAQLIVFSPPLPL